MGVGASLFPLGNRMKKLFNVLLPYIILIKTIRYDIIIGCIRKREADDFVFHQILEEKRIFY